MTQRGPVFVHGLWHLGAVTAACLGRAIDVVAHDDDPAVCAALAEGRAALAEPGLDELLQAGLTSGRLRATGELAHARGCPVVWIAIDTPIDAGGGPDAEAVMAALGALAPELDAGALVVVGSQVPVGFCRAALAELERRRAGAGLRVACVPENLRLGDALGRFAEGTSAAGTHDGAPDPELAGLLDALGAHPRWMTLESAELAKHARNAFLATSVALVNEIARIAERTGADAADVEAVLRADERIGTRAYVRAGEAFDGATLGRDLAALERAGERLGTATPLVTGVRASNDEHRGWALAALERAAGPLGGKRIAVLGLAAKVGSDSLRGSAGVALCEALLGHGSRVVACDPAVAELPAALAADVELLSEPRAALRAADAAVVTTPWPQFAQLDGAEIAELMESAVIVDPTRSLEHTADEERVLYARVGKATSSDGWT